MSTQLLKEAEEIVGVDWDGVTVLEDDSKLPVAMPDYIATAVGNGDIKSVLRWINANRTEDRVNAISSVEKAGIPPLYIASLKNHPTLMTLLLQLGADANFRDSQGWTALSLLFADMTFASGNVISRVAADGDTSEWDEWARLLLSWVASFFPEAEHCGSSKEYCISQERKYGKPKLANLLESELGGRRCEIVNLSSQSDLNGKTCVTDEYLPDSNQYKVTLETKRKEVLVLCPDNLKRRDRTPEDCGYYIEFKNGRAIRHDFDSSEDCQAFVAALSRGKTQPAVMTDEAEARAEQAAAELLAELGLNNAPDNVDTGVDQVKKSRKKKKGGKKKKKAKTAEKKKMK